MTEYAKQYIVTVEQTVVPADQSRNRLGVVQEIVSRAFSEADSLELVANWVRRQTRSSEQYVRVSLMPDGSPWWREIGP